MSASSHVSQLNRPATLPGWGARLTSALLRLVVIVAAGAVLGLLVGGVGGRLAMMLLAGLSPEATGLESDDGFVMGRFTASGTLNLLLIGAYLGGVGGIVYALLRGLMVGPRWFQVLSVGGGPAVVVGALIVHTDGVDFRLLHPTWLAIALFVAIPGVYAALLTVVAERVLRAVGPSSQPPGRRTTRGTASTAGTSDTTGTKDTAVSAVKWSARLGLTVVFAAALLDLVKDTAELV